MTSFLVIDDDRESSAVIARTLLERGLEVRIVRSDDEAATAMAERPADVVLTPADLKAADDCARIERLRTHVPLAATIILAAEPGEIERAVADELGLAGVVGRGALEADLPPAIARAREVATGFRGSLHGLDLGDVLQMFSLNRRTLSVYVGGRAAGRIDFDNGEIAHAVSSNLTGRDALAAMLSSSSGSVRTAPRADSTRTITRDFAALMLETVQQVDEAVRSGANADHLLPMPEEITLDETTLDARLASLDRTSVLPAFAEDGATSDLWASSLPELAEVLPIMPAVSSAPRRFDALCRALLAEVPGALAIAVVHVASATLVGAELGIPVDRAFGRDWATYFGALFGGAEALALASRLDEGPYIEEAHILTRHGYFLGRPLRGGSHALLVMLPHSGDVAAAWAAIRGLMRGVESNL